MDYFARLWFRDLLDIEIRVVAVGRTSLTYSFEVRRGDDVAARGSMVAVNSDPDVGDTTPWTDTVRKALLESGQQTPELLVSG